MSHDRGCPCGKEKYEYDDCKSSKCIQQGASGSPAPTSDAELAELASDLTVLVMERRFAELDKRLLAVDMTSAEAVVMLMHLRCTFPARAFLQEWEPLLQVVRTELKRRRLDADRLLRGLGNATTDAMTGDEND